MFEIAESGDQGTITVRGAITIACACEFRDALIHIQDRWSSLDVNLDGVTEIDVTGMQLLCSAHRTAVKLDKRLALIGQMAESVYKTAFNAGFLREQACTMGGEHGCLWAGRKKP